MKLDYKSVRGDILPLSENEYFYISNIDGHTSAAASLASSVIGGVDGDTVNSVQAQPRTIIIDLTIFPNIDVETAKREILKIIKLKQNGSLIWTQNERTVEITGVIESVDMPRWNNNVVMQITIHCEQPFWEDVDYIVSQISEAINLHYFTEDYHDMLYFPEAGIPFGEYDTIRTKQFYNSGDVAIGLEISIVATSTVTNPIIYNQDGNYFGVGYASRPVVMQSGDVVNISTVRGRKSVTLNGVNILDKVKPQSTWVQLETGDNSFSINSDDESITNMIFNIEYKQRYI